VNGDAKLGVSGEALLGGASTVLLVLALPLKSVGGFETVFISMLFRPGGLVEGDEKNDAVVFEDDS
jgi:hypothetical protein